MGDELSKRDLGFYLYRLEDGGERYVPVNEKLVPALLDAPQGALYRVLDPEARGESFSYVLMEVESGPKGTDQVFHGPYTVRVDEEGASRAPRRRGASEEAFAYAVSSTERARRSESAFKLTRSRGRAPEPRAKIAVESDGLYSLSVSEIASVLGIPETEARRRLQSRSFQLTNGGGAVAWTRSSDGARLLFRGRGVESIYTRENIYWLEPGPGIEMPKARRPDTKTGKSEGATGTSFRYTAHFEEDACSCDPRVQRPGIGLLLLDVRFERSPDVRSGSVDRATRRARRSFRRIPARGPSLQRDR